MVVKAAKRELVKLKVVNHDKKKKIEYSCLPDYKRIELFKGKKREGNVKEKDESKRRGGKIQKGKRGREGNTSLKKR